MVKHIFVLDNQDSFVFNLVDFLYQITSKISVYRNTANANDIFDKMIESQQNGESPILLLSPGPKAPSDVPAMEQLLKLSQGKFPVLGVCLGHQAIVEFYGGVVGRCQNIMHGKASFATLPDHPIFEGIDTNMKIARYHSLGAEKMPDNLTILAKSNDDDAVMAVINEDDKIIGFQFHPESVLTVDGEQLLRNTFKYMTGEK